MKREYHVTVDSPSVRYSGKCSFPLSNDLGFLDVVFDAEFSHNDSGDFSASISASVPGLPVYQGRLWAKYFSECLLDQLFCSISASVRCGTFRFLVKPDLDRINAPSEEVHDHD